MHWTSIKCDGQDVPDLRYSGRGTNVVQGSVFFNDEEAGSYPFEGQSQRIYRSPSKATNDDNVSKYYTLTTPDLHGCG